jgi:dipeptidyl aminopeptidase/acylaminoacyl peptidase
MKSRNKANENRISREGHCMKKGAKKRSKKKIASIIIGSILLLAIIICVGISVYVGQSMTHPEKKPIDQFPSDYGMQYEDITFPSREDGLNLSGWVLTPDTKPKMTVVFAHGYKGNRFEDHVSFFDMAADLLDLGYRVIMFDFRYAGNSDGEMSTVGAKEQLDLLGAIDWADANYDEPIGLLGISMGASTSLLAAAQTDKVAAVVADSPFSDLEEYLKENLPVWSDLPNFPFTPMIMTIMPLITDLDPKEASPISVLDDIAPRPILFIHNKRDASIPYTESEKMAEAYSGLADLWLPDGEGHVKA